MVHDSSSAMDSGALDRLCRLGGKDLVRKVIGICLEQMPARIQDAWDQLGHENLDGVAKAAHAVRSSAGNVGAASVGAIAGRIEVLASQREPAEIPSLLAELDRAYRSAKTFLEEKSKDFET